jgi:ABC-type glycerol-3-phosphate transport system permease component
VALPKGERRFQNATVVGIGLIAISVLVVVMTAFGLKRAKTAFGLRTPTRTIVATGISSLRRQVSPP